MEINFDATRAKSRFSAFDVGTIGFVVPHGIAPDVFQLYEVVVDEEPPLLGAYAIISLVHAVRF